MSSSFSVRVSMQVLRESMRSCESCRYQQAEFVVHDTFVCVGCAEAAR